MVKENKIVFLLSYIICESFFQVFILSVGVMFGIFVVRNEPIETYFYLSILISFLFISIILKLIGEFFKFKLYSPNSFYNRTRR